MAFESNQMQVQMQMSTIQMQVQMQMRPLRGIQMQVQMQMPHLHLQVQMHLHFNTSLLCAVWKHTGDAEAACIRLGLLRVLVDRHLHVDNGYDQRYSTVTTRQTCWLESLRLESDSSR